MGISKSLKLSLICFLILNSSIELFSQEHQYIVDNIKGIVLINETDTLKIGDTITEQSNLTFIDNNSLLKLYDSKTNKFPIISPFAKANTNNEYEININNYFITSHNAMTKGDIEIKTLKNFIDYYSTPIFLIFDESRVKVNIPKLKIDSINFMYVNYKYRGNGINYKLVMEDESLLINEEIFIFNDELIEPDSIVSIWYYKSQKKDSYLMVENFNPVFLNHSESITEITEKADLLKSLNNNSLSDIVDPLHLFINHNYGFIDKYNLNIWINNRYNK